MKKTQKQAAKDRITDAVINGETPDPVDIETAKRASVGGRPKKNTLITCLDDWHIWEDYIELREQGLSYNDACSVLATKEDRRRRLCGQTAGIDLIKAVITKINNDAKASFFKYSTDDEATTQSKWEKFLKEHKAYCRDYFQSCKNKG